MKIENRAWWELILPHEEPKVFRGRSKWRDRHERIYILEKELKLIPLSHHSPPWYDDIGW